MLWAKRIARYSIAGIVGFVIITTILSFATFPSETDCLDRTPPPYDKAFADLAPYSIQWSSSSFRGVCTYHLQPPAGGLQQPLDVAALP